MSAATHIAQVEHCNTMADVRRHIDALDARIVPLIAERSAYVAQAARIKSSEDQIVDEPRIESIIERVRAQARAAGMPEAIIEAAYRAMISASINFELGEFKRLRREV